MITVDQLKELGFVHEDYLGINEFICTKKSFRNDVIIALSDDGVVTYVREFNNYHGLKTNIKSMRQLHHFFHYLS